jgi:hypothetical protein
VRVSHGPRRRSAWVWHMVRGQCSEPVTPKDKPKSLLSCKSFAPTSDPVELARWMGILAAEVAERCADDEEEHGRRARTLGTRARTRASCRVETCGAYRCARCAAAWRMEGAW